MSSVVIKLVPTKCNLGRKMRTSDGSVLIYISYVNKITLYITFNNLTNFCLFLQVWFQNKRSKERRLKQLTSMGRGPFFGSSRKMRGFPMNLSPGGLDEAAAAAAAAGFPYFATADGKFEFGYGGPPFHAHDGPFFPHHGPGPMPFGQQGNYRSYWTEPQLLPHLFFCIGLILQNTLNFLT